MVVFTLEPKEDKKYLKTRNFKWFTVSDFLCADEAMLTTTCRGKRDRFFTVLWTLDFLTRPILPRNRS